MVKPVPALGSFHTGSPSHCAAAGVASNAVSPSSNIVRVISPSQRLGETGQDQGGRSGGDGPTVGTAGRGVNAVSLYGTHTAPIDTRLLGGWGGWGRLEKVWGGRAGGGTTSTDLHRPPPTSITSFSFTSRAGDGSPRARQRRTPAGSGRPSASRSRRRRASRRGRS